MGISGTGVRRLQAVALAAVVLAGCSTPEEDAGTSDAEPDAAAGQDTGEDAEEGAEEDQTEQPVDDGEPDPAARRAVKAAIIELLRANTGRFELDVPLGGDASVSERGSYQVEPLAHDVVRELASPDGTLVIAQRAEGDRQWVRLESASSQDGETEGWPCWVSGDDLARLPGSPVGELAGVEGQPPSAVVSATYGIGRQRTGPGSFTGTTDLALALGLLGSKALQASGVDPQGDATVPAAFSVEQDALVEVAVSLDDVPAAVEASGATVPPELADLTSAAGVMTTRFVDLGAPVDITPPAARDVLVLDDPADFEAAMESCGSG